MKSFKAILFLGPSVLLICVLLIFSIVKITEEPISSLDIARLNRVRIGHFPLITKRAILLVDNRKTALYFTNWFCSQLLAL